MVLQVGPGAGACVSAPGSAGSRVAEGGRADQPLSRNREKKSRSSLSRDQARESGGSLFGVRNLGTGNYKGWHRAGAEYRGVDANVELNLTSLRQPPPSPGRSVC